MRKRIPIVKRQIKASRPKSSDGHKMKYDCIGEQELIEVCLNCPKEVCTTGDCEVFKAARRKLKRRKERQDN